ncbi:MAG: hypothetical protein K2K93_07830, partial [Muribaculaceae bacterium]|nr:hypothetical protein [Muribaculaceae bacterium]
MRKAKGPDASWSLATPVSAPGSKKITPNFTTPKADTFQYLEGPDGSTWYATCKYDTETRELEGGYATEQILKGYTFTIYDSDFKEVGTVSDVITLEGNENRCAQVSLDVAVTKKFFNYDNNYEVMVTWAMNTPDYTVNTRTKVYSIGKAHDGEYDTPIAVIPGMPVDVINLSTNSWSEDFFITFLTEKNPDPNAEYPEYIDYLAQFYQVLTTYTKAGSNGEASPINVHETQMLCLPGDQMSTPSMLSKNIDGKLTLIYTQYEKSLFIDPSGMGGNEDLTPDNRLIIDVEQLNDNYPRTFDKICSTSIETSRRSDDPNVLYTFYGIGTLGYDADADFTHYSEDGSPCFVVTIDEYLINDDDNYNSSYYVYNSKGERIKTISEDTFNFANLSDVPGFEPQTMFIHTGDEMIFEFVDLYSAKRITEVDQMYRGYPLTLSIDRVSTGHGYAYAVASGFGDYDEDGNLFAPLLWLDMDGELIRVDNIPAGQGVELAQIYVTQTALSPFVFNTDSDIEYMMLVKRRVNPEDIALREEFLIATVKEGPIHTFLPDDDKGDIFRVFLMGTDDKKLVIAYSLDDALTAESYTLPFTKFQGGKGTSEDPYLIATAGDFCQIHNYPSAHYRLTADIDCSGTKIPMTAYFTGSINGMHHSVSNVYIESSKRAALFGDAQNASFKDIDFYDCTVELNGSGDAALLCVNPIETTFDNINVRRLKVFGDTFDGCFGGIVGKAFTRSNITGCQVADADINLPKGNTVGGIAGELRTSSAIKSSAFIGNIVANNTLGGIVGTTTTGDEVVSDCHVDASLKARNTVGGIAGFLNRSTVTRCYVEGSIEVTEPSRWTNALAAGGIAGELEGDWEHKSNTPVTKNLIGLTEIKYPKLTIKESYPHQLATVHRVVGRTSYNAEPEVDHYDENDNPVYKDKVVYEYGVQDNLVTDNLACIDPDFLEKTVEGTSINKNDIDVDMLKEKLGFAYGTNYDAPWSLNAWNAWDPMLYFENMVYLTSSNVTVAEGDVFMMEIAIVSRERYSAEEIMDGFLCEFNDKVIEMTGNMQYADNLMQIEFRAIAEGRTKVNVSILSGNATCRVIVKNPSSGV